MGRSDKESLFQGTELTVCPRCTAPVAARFCGRCGEELGAAVDGWFTLFVDGGTKRNRQDLKRLERYPGPREDSGSRMALVVQHAGHLDWLRERVPRLLQSATTFLVGGNGQRFGSGDPIFACLMGVMDSRIRGCMTQKSRPAVCWEEATLLPLREELKTDSLADQLLAAGFEKEARLLVLGTLAELGGSHHKLHCPLFGRALRMDSGDIRRLPFLLADYEVQRNDGPMVLPLGKKGRTACSQRRSIRSGKTVGDLRTRVLAGEARIGGKGAYSFAHSTPCGVVGGYQQAGGRAVVDVLGFAGEGKTARVTIPAADMDWDGAQCVLLAVRDNAFEIIAGVPGQMGARTGLWQARNLPQGDWRLLVAGQDYYWVWGPQGVLALLGPDCGWLLTPVGAEGRLLTEGPEAANLAGVVAADRCSPQRIAVLSSHGHRVTVLERTHSRDLGTPPVASRFDAVLPARATGLTTDEQGRLILVDDRHGYRLDWRRRETLILAEAGEGERLVALAGGGLAAIGPAGLRMCVMPGSSVSPLDSAGESGLALLAQRVRLGEEGALTVYDRQGRPPQRVTWGS